MQNALIFLFLVGCAAEESAPTPAPTRSVVARPAEAQTCLRTKTFDAGLKNWAVRTRFTATLEAGQIHKEPMTVLDRVEYRLDACGDAGVVDAGLRVVDGEGATVGEASGSREPFIEFGPGDWGELEIVIEQRALKAAGTGAIAIAVEYREIEETAKN